METRGLSHGEHGLPHWLAPYATWFASTDPRAAGRLDLDRLDQAARRRDLRLPDGQSLRFVAAGPPRAAADYERGIAATGEVPTRHVGRGMVHDWLNALCWLRWPAIKARLNALHVAALAQGPVLEQPQVSQARSGRRGALRDALTLLDESGALFVHDEDQTATWLRAFDWHRLFVADRQAFMRYVCVLVIGHGLMEKLLDPYKGICAQALPVRWPQTSGPASDLLSLATGGDGALDSRLAASLDDPFDSLDVLDRHVAASLSSRHLRPADLSPLPVLGVPGWAAGNDDPGFYDDPEVFRSRRCSAKKP